VVTVRTYKVMVRGIGVPLLVDGVVGNYGFNTPRFVKAEDEERARRQACAEVLELLKERVHAVDGVADQHTLAVVTVSTCEGEPPSVKPGFAWFREQVGPDE
jgi:hypothetical protein